MSLAFRRSPPARPTLDWVRIDKHTASAQPVAAGTALRVAHGFLADATAAFASGRFHTPFAIYSRVDCLEATDPRPAGVTDAS